MRQIGHGQLQQKSLDQLRQIRLDRARELLVMTSLRLDEISRRTGFCDQYYFSRVFKQKFGVSPGKYMK